jgi:hypothetical protein
MALCHAISKLSAKSIGSRQSKYLIAAADNVNRTGCFVVPLNPDTEHTLAGSVSSTGKLRPGTQHQSNHPTR